MTRDMFFGRPLKSRLAPAERSLSHGGSFVLRNEKRGNAQGTAAASIRLSRRIRGSLTNVETNAPTDGLGGLSSRWRALASRGATAAARWAFPRAVGRVSDPVSVFFAIRRATLDVGSLRPRGFKILLEILARNPHLRVREVPFTFAERVGGHSKESIREAGRYLRQLAELRLSAASRFGRMARFAMVGASGVAVNLIAVAALLSAGVPRRSSSEVVAAVVATQLAVAWNFVLTERWVFPERPGHWLRRLVLFWGLSCAALLAQLPLAALLQRELDGSYVLATAAALGLLALARFTVCDVVLYRGARAGMSWPVAAEGRVFRDGLPGARPDGEL